MRVIGLLLIAGLLVSPVWLLNEFVMPELSALQDMYAHLDETAQQIATSD